MPPSDYWLYKFRRRNAWVFVPSPDTVVYGQEVKDLIEKLWKAPSYYYHLRKGGHVAALTRHKSNEYFLHLDIKNFFGHINASRVTRCLKGLGGKLTYSKSREIAIYSTVHNPKVPSKTILPFGFVQSPIIASVYLRDCALGKCLHELSKQVNIDLSVYMDDIILSSNDLTALKDALKKIERASHLSALPLNKKKQQGPCKKILAFNIELSQSNLAVETARLGAFLTAFHGSSNKDQKAGIRQYIKTINSSQALAFPSS